MGIYTNIEGILMVNVTIYSIHGSYGVRGKERPAAVSFFGKRLDLWWIRHDTMISLFFCRGAFPVNPFLLTTWQMLLAGFISYNRPHNHRIFGPTMIQKHV